MRRKRVVSAPEDRTIFPPGTAAVEGQSAPEGLLYGDLTAEEEKPDMASVPTELAASLFSKQMNETTDELNTELETAGVRLGNMNLGVSASVSLSNDEGWSECLTFGKHGQLWDLLYQCG